MQGLLNIFRKKTLVPQLTNFDSEIRQVADPERVVIPLDYPGKVRYIPTVKVGDQVHRGQVIGRSRIGNCVCASISGTVKEMTSIWTAQSFQSPAIVIENNGDTSNPAVKIFDGPIDAASDQEAAMNRLRTAGVAPPWSLSGREYPKEGDLPELPPVETIVITGVRQETTILTSQLLLEKYADKVVDALKRLSAIAPNARICITAPEDSRSWAETKFKNLADVEYVPQHYMGRIEREVISKIVGKRIPNRESYRFHGIGVLDVEYLLAIVDALDGVSPFTQKCLTISGTDIDRAITVRFPLGSSIEHVLASQGLSISGYTRPVVGGPMMGFAQYSETTPLTYNNGLYLVAGDVTPFDAIAPCINCGRCARICPVGIQVHLVNRMIEFGQIEAANKLHPEACHECGLCANVCPAERPIVQLLHFCNHEMVHGERYNWITGDNS
ncbi:MAG: electron transport complex protein RnfC [Desulforhopalus sp.]|jgi:electron transport complex protein RnfC